MYFEESYLHGNESSALEIAIIHSKNDNDDLAMEYYKKALDINPDYTDALINLGYLYTKKYEYKKAFECYKKAYKIDKNRGVVLSNLGVFYERGYAVEKDLDKARSYYELAHKAGYKTGAWHLANLYYDEKNGILNIDKAMEYYKICLEFSDYEKDANLSLADIYIWHTKEYRKAFEILESIGQDNYVAC